MRRLARESRSTWAASTCFFRVLVGEKWPGTTLLPLQGGCWTKRARAVNLRQETMSRDAVFECCFTQACPSGTCARMTTRCIKCLGALCPATGQLWVTANRPATMSPCLVQCVVMACWQVFALFFCVPYAYTAGSRESAFIPNQIPRT